MMRQKFAEFIYTRMLTDQQLMVVTADLGYGMWDKISKVYPTRFINYGAAEMGALAFCIGLSYQGFKPIFYSINSFALWRPAELIRNYLNHEQAKVMIAFSGRGTDYEHDGWTHNATDIPAYVSNFNHIPFIEPTEENIVPITSEALDHLPAIISLSR